MSYEIVSFYRFVPLSEQKINEILLRLNAFSEEISLAGLLIIAPEGLNGTLATPKGKIEILTNYLINEITDGDWRFKFSFAEFSPYKRFSLKLREEIVTSGYPEHFPEEKDSSHLSPKEWHEALKKEKEYFLIDVRNDYEVELGTFKNAINPKTKDFKEFPQFVEESNLPKDKPIYMCCTGGIRCEKAYLEMKERGYEKVYQLDGGILTYLEQYPVGLFEGECFVFDDRVALDKNLYPSQKYALCPHCGDPASDLLECKMCGTTRKICPACQLKEEKKTCSKNCSYHYALKLNKEADKEMNGHKTQISNAALILIAFLLSFSSLFQISNLKAESNPESTVMDAIGKMKEEGNPAPIVDFIDWEQMYSDLPEEKKSVMKVDSPDSLMHFYRKVLSSPSSEFTHLIESKLQGVIEKDGKAGTEGKFADAINKLQNRLKEKETEVKNKLQNTEYEVISSKIDGEKAIVELKQNYKGETKVDNIKLHQKNNKWYFSSLSDALGQSKKID